MRILSAITAMTLTTLPVPAEASRSLRAGAAGGARAADDDDAPMRVAVLPIAVEGSLPAADRDALEAAVARGLASDSYELVDPAATDRLDTRACRTASCREGHAQRVGATHLVEVRVKAAPREYEVELSAYAKDAEEPFATTTGSCSICGLAEIEQVVASKADALRQRLTSREVVPAYVAVSSVPSGSVVRIDGREVGVTPYSGEVKPGPHTIEVVRSGFFGETKSVTAARGVRERFHASLTPVPRHSARRVIGWTALGVGLASLAGGATMLALDGREHGPKCRADGQRDAEGDCRYVHKTLGGGIALTVAGATLTATGVTLLLVDRKRHKTYPLRASVSPRRVALTFRF